MAVNFFHGAPNVSGKEARFIALRKEDNSPTTILTQ
jgi:hypothetical protein